MANGVQNPLGEDDLEAINQQLQNITEVENLMRKARSAGIDLGDREEQLREDRARLLKIKQTFFPGR